MANEQQILHVSPRMKALEIKMHLELKSHPAEKVPYVISRCRNEIRSRDMLDQMYILSFDAAVLDEVLRQEPAMKVILNSSTLRGSMAPEDVKEHGFRSSRNMA